MPKFKYHQNQHQKIRLKKVLRKKNWNTPTQKIEIFNFLAKFTRCSRFWTIRKIELNCPADNIPKEIVIDLSGTDIGTSIKISAVKLPENVIPTITDRDFVVATVAAPTDALSIFVRPIA